MGQKLEDLKRRKQIKRRTNQKNKTMSFKLNKNKFDFGSKKPNNKRGWSTDLFGERDFSEHNIHARKTEGRINRKKKKK